jgi:putative flippase GtrA
MKVLLRQAAGYGVSAFFALTVDMSILWILVRYLGVPYLSAATLSYLAGAGVAYSLSIRLAFKDHRLSNRTTEFVSFVAIGTLGLVVNACVIDVVVRYLGLHVMIAKCVAAACTFMCNFMARRQLLFVRSRSAGVVNLSHE